MDDLSRYPMMQRMEKQQEEQMIRGLPLVIRKSKTSKVESLTEFKAPDVDDLKKRNYNSVELSAQKYSIFSQQNVETSHFDVTFQFKDKQLHAHSFVLWPASDVFETMLFGKWAKKEPIPITGHSFDDFKEFLTFLYLGMCTVTKKNIMALIDLAESYSDPISRRNGRDNYDDFMSYSYNLNTYKLYIIRNQEGKFALKDFSQHREKDRNDSTKNYIQHTRVNTNGNWKFQGHFERHDENFVPEIIARVRCNKEKFVVGDNCYVTVIENPSEIH